MSDKSDHVEVSPEMVEAGLYQSDLCADEQATPAERMVRIYQTMEEQRRIDQVSTGQ